MESAKTALDTANAAVTEKKAELESAQAEATRKTALDFFTDLDENSDAANAIKNATYAEYTDTSSEKDATDLDNMKSAIQWLYTLNEIRTAAGLSELKVSSMMMAYAQSNANYSDRVIAHSQQFNCGENLAWNYSNNPSADYSKTGAFYQWYTAEKAVFDSAVSTITDNTVTYTNKNGAQKSFEVTTAQKQLLETVYSENKISNKNLITLSQELSDFYSTVGHYLNIINSDYVLAGFAVNHKGTNYPYTYSNTFALAETGTTYTVAEYETKFNEYYNKVQEKKEAVTAIEKELETAQENAKTAQTEYDNAVEEQATYKNNVEELAQAVADAQAKKNATEETLTAATAAYDAAKTTKDETETKYNTAKEELEAKEEALTTAKTEYEKASATVTEAETKLSEAQEAQTKAQQEVTTAEKALQEAQNSVEEADTAYTIAVQNRDWITDQEYDTYEESDAFSSLNKLIEDGKKAQENLQTLQENAEKAAETVTEKSEAVTKAEDAVTEATSAYNTAKTAYNSAVAAEKAENAAKNQATTSAKSATEAATQKTSNTNSGTNQTTQATQTTQTPVNPRMTLNASSIVLKVKQSSSALKVTDLIPGDSVVSWKSSNKKVFTVNASGKLKAGKKPGKAKLTITLKSGLTKTIPVKVQKGTVKTTRIVLQKKKVTLNKGQKYKLSPVLTPITTQEKVKYTSSNKKIATVNGKGQVTAKKAGKTVITVKSGKKTVKCTITVK